MEQDINWLLNEKYLGRKTAGFSADCERLKAGEPLSYVIGWVPFLGCKIWLDSRPLIPRPETEWWVEKAVASISKAIPRESLGANIMEITVPRTDLGFTRGRSSGEDSVVQSQAAGDISILDLCAGSGCIGVAIAKHVRGAHVTFAEIDPTHLPTIEKNRRKNSTIDRTILLCSDLFEQVAGTFDFILANPPYIDPAIDRAEQSVKRHEPHLALYGGQGGIEIIERIIKGARGHLTASGELWIEHEPEHVPIVTDLAHTHGFTASSHSDQFGVLRFSILVLQ